MPVLAGDWKTSNSLSLETTYSNNTGLSQSNGDNGLVLEVRPSVGLHGKGARLSMDFDYGLGLVKRSSGGQLEDSHFLNANANAELLEQVLFIDVTANAGISTISRGGVNATDHLSDTSNTTQTFTFSISPYTKHHLGSYADITTRLTHDQVRNDTGGADNSHSESVSVDVASGRHFTTFGWSLSADHSRLSNEQGPTDKNTHFNAGVNYRFNRKVRANFSLGYEKNSIQSNSGDTSGMTWDAGVTLTPNVRTTLDLSYGKQYFGNRWSMDFKYKHRHTDITASYSKTLTNSRSEQLQSVLTPFIDPITGQQQFVEQTLPTLSTTNFVQDNFTVGYGLSLRRTRISADGRYAQRSSELGGADTTDTSLSASVSHDLTPKTSANLRLSRTNQETDGSSADQVTTVASLGMNSQIGKKTSVGISLQRSKSDGGSNDYTENRIGASLTTSF